MNNKKTKKVVYVLIFIFIVLGIVLVILTRPNSNNPANSNNPNENPGETPTNPGGNPTENDSTITPKILNDASEFFTVQSILETYFNHIQNQDSTAVFNILSRTYTSENNLNTTNCLVENIPYENYIYKATKINYYELNENVTIYFIVGEVKEDLFEGTTSNPLKKYHLVSIDLANFTYNIAPLTDVNEYNNALTKTKISAIAQTISKNSYNTFKFKNVNIDTLVSTYYYYYLDKLLHAPKEAYDLLNKEYRDKRFKTYEEFTTYVNENITSLGEATITNFRYKEGTTNTFYITNSNGDTIIFRSRGIMQLEVYLDEVTIKF